MLRGKIIKAAMLILIGVLSIEAHAQIMANYYVSPSGNDGWPGTEAQPFRTIEKARDVIRERSGEWTGDIYVWLRGGTYSLTNTLEFGEEDSGKDGHYVAYQAYTGERPIVSGGIPVTGWSHCGGGIYKAQCGSLEFRQLYVDGRKAIRARTPNAGSFNRLVAWNTSNETIRINAGELGNVQNLSNDKVEMIVQQYWAESIMRISSVDVSGSFKDITVNSEERNIVFSREWPQKSPDQAYHFENSLDFLDQEGEWYLDDNSSPHYVYYKPRQGEDMASAEVVAPVLDRLITVAGDGFEDHAHHLVFEGITFEHANWIRPTNHGNIGLQSQQFSVGGNRCDRPEAAFYIENADHMRLTRNVFRNCGSVGLDIYISTQDIVVEGNVFHDIAGNGMQIGKFSEPDAGIAAVYNPSDPLEYCESNIVANNYIYTCATEYYCANGIAAGYVRNTSIVHNEVTDLPYTGVNSGWGWSFSVSAMSNNHIEYNLIYDVMRLLCDGAGIYTLGNQGPASTIKYNYVYNTIRSSWATTQHTATYPVASIYLDQGSAGFTIDQNCVVNSNSDWRVNFNGTESYNTLGVNPSNDPAIINNAGIQPAFQDIKLIDPKPAPPNEPPLPIPASGLKLWLKADSGPATIVMDENARVNTWGDQSGNTHTALQSTASYQPAYVSNAINGLPAIRFDGTDDRMNVYGMAGAMNEFTFVMAIKPDGLANYNQSIGAVGGWGQFLFHAAANGAIYCGTDVAARLTAPGGTMTDSEFQEYTFVYRGLEEASGLYKNGTLIASDVLAETPAAWTGFVVGAVGSNTLKGDVPEIIIYDRALTENERQSVACYLDSKYAGNIQGKSSGKESSFFARQDNVSGSPTIYPTIVEDVFYIDLNIDSPSPVEVSLYSLEGRKLRQVNFENVRATDDHLALNKGNLAPGVYIYHIETNERRVKGKIIVSQ